MQPQNPFQGQANGWQQQPNMQQQAGGQPIMQQPPNVLTTKDHHYLNDMISWNLDALKKAHFFAEQCQDPEIRQTLQAVGQLHQRHYGILLNHLQHHQQQNPQQAAQQSQQNLNM
ncbi:MAG TPA: hypothetical protein VFK44_03205 [Bacillales bacterium]|nr:hypothetical protein [Bacillales bacterium]